MKQEREFFDTSDLDWTAAPGSAGVEEYACRPIGMPHGPYRTESGCTMLETRY